MIHPFAPGFIALAPSALAQPAPMPALPPGDFERVHWDEAFPDLNRDGIVNFGDLNTALAHFGIVC